MAKKLFSFRYKWQCRECLFFFWRVKRDEPILCPKCRDDGGKKFCGTFIGNECVDKTQQLYTTFKRERRG